MERLSTPSDGNALLAFASRFLRGIVQTHVRIRLKLPSLDIAASVLTAVQLCGESVFVGKNTVPSP